jgi:ERF superfamily protein
MTDAPTELAAHKPTAKQLAEQALTLAQENHDVLGELRAEIGTYRTELRENGMAGPFPPSDLQEKIAALDKDIEGIVDGMNKLAAAIGAGAAGSQQGADAASAEALQALDIKVAETFKAQGEIIARWGKVLEEARENSQHAVARAQSLAELLENRTDQPTVDHALAEMEQRYAELKGDLQHFAEGVSGTLAQQGDMVAQVWNRVQGEGVKVVDVDSRTIEYAPRPATAPAVPMIYAQVHELMRLVSQIGKDSQADQKMGGYKFRSIEAAMDVVGHALREVGVMFQPRKIVDRRIERYEATNQYGKPVLYTHVWVTQEYAFVSLRDGSEMNAIEMDGEARDTGDKSTSKADSMRYKYALLQALCIPINGLPESDGRDGTEGDFAPAVGRGSAGDAFDSASPQRPQQTADAVQRNAAVHPGDTNTPVESAPAPPAPDTRTPGEKAAAAVTRLYQLARMEDRTQARETYTRIALAAEEQGLSEVVVSATVDGQEVEARSLARHLVIVNGLLAQRGA